MPDLNNPFFYPKFKRRVSNLIILTCFLMFLPLIYYNLNCKQINCETYKETYKTFDLKTHESILNGDSTPPEINIHSPRNGTIVGSFPPDFNVTVNDANFHKFWFIFNNSAEIYFWVISPGNSIVWLPYSEWQTIPEGYLRVTFFANDTAGNINSADIMIIKRNEPQIKEIPGINSSQLYLVLIITSTVIVIFSIRKIQN